MMPRKIRMFWLVSAGLVLTTAAVVAAVLWPRMTTSALYRSYASQQGIAATFLRDFPINDTLTVDVTILQATDTMGWETLKRDFGIKDFPQEILPLIDTNAVSFKYAPKADHSALMDSTIPNNDYIAFSQHRRHVTVFEIQSKEQAFAITLYCLKIRKKLLLWNVNLFMWWR